MPLHLEETVFGSPKSLVPRFIWKSAAWLAFGLVLAGMMVLMGFPLFLSIAAGAAVAAWNIMCKLLKYKHYRWVWYPPD